jgi:hypothetical protein
MKKVVLFALVLFAFARCANEAKKEGKMHEKHVVTEEVKRYALSPLDSVYSVQVKLTSLDTAVIEYWVELNQDGILYSDSLNFFIPAGENVNGQIIFPDCTTKNQPKPTLTSKVKRLE